MKAHYDPSIDALAISWGDMPIEESDEIESGVILDYDKKGNVVGIELLNASRKIEHLTALPLNQRNLSQR